MIDTDRLDLQDPRAVDRWLPAARLVERYHRYTVHGLEHVPRQGPALLALNHGPVPIDAPLLGKAIYQDQQRLPRGLTDHMVFELPVLRYFFTRAGAVDGRHDTAETLLERGNLVIVMPGGAPEAFKPSSRAYELYWRQRTSFARLAIHAQVPIVPAACVGIDELYTVPVDMFELGKRVFGVRSMPLPLAWGLGPLPRRVRLTHHIGAPHAPPPPEAADDEAAVLAFRDQVTDAMEALLAEGLRQRAVDESVRR